MSLTLAFVMDPLEKVNIRTDTSFALMLAGHLAGHRIIHVAPQAIGLENNMPVFLGQHVQVYNSLGNHFKVIEKISLYAKDCQAIFIRTDPPFDDAYLHVTWMLSLAERQGVRCINSPSGIRSANEKLYALNFPELCPETIVTASHSDILAFLKQQHGEAIAKPTDGHGGYGVVRLHLGDSNVHAIIDLLTQEGIRPIVVQQFLPEAAFGDKRLLVVDGELRGIVRRVPKSDDHRGNVHVGGSTEACPISPIDEAIVATMQTRLRADGLFFVGLDVIGDKLIEVNVTSPTLVQELRNLGGPDLAQEMIARITQVA